MYQEKLRKSNLAKQTASIASEDSAIKVDTTDSTRHRQGYSYENGATGFSDYEKKGKVYRE